MAAIVTRGGVVRAAETENVVPTGADQTLPLGTGRTHVFTLADFGFRDADGDAFGRLLMGVRPEQDRGALLFDPDGPGGAAARRVQSDFFDAADIAAGKITYTAPSRGLGAIDLFSFKVEDARGELDETSRSMRADVFAANQAPTVATGADPVTATENVYRQVDYGVTVSDPDSDGAGQIKSAMVRVAAGYRPGEDDLSFRPTYAEPITAVWDAATGALRLTATAALDASGWGRMLAQVFYRDTSDAPARHARTIAFTVSDGELDSAPAFKTVAVAAVNDAPRLDLNGAAEGTTSTVGYSENASAVALSPDALVTDADSPSLSGGELRVKRVGTTGDGNYVLAVADGGTGAGQIGVSGGRVTYGGVAIGTVSGGVGAELVVALADAATPEAAQALARAITYRRTGDTAPSTRPEFDVRLGDGEDMPATGIARVAVNVAAVDDPFTLDLDGTAGGVDALTTVNWGSSGIAPARVAPGAVAFDRDSGLFATGRAAQTLTVAVADARAGDALALFFGAGADEVQLDGDRVSHRGRLIGLVTLEGVTAARFEFTGEVTVAAVQALVRAVGLATGSGDPAVRTLGFHFEGPVTMTRKATVVSATYDGRVVLRATAGDDLLEGGAVEELASYADAGAGVAASLAASGAQATGGSGNDTLRGVEGLIGSAFADRLAGDARGNVLLGGGGDDLLDGGAAADLLDGGTGADRMVGGSGDDTYRIDSAGDRVVELAGEGVDTAISSVSVDFGVVKLENLTLTGSANLYGYGNELANVLTGNAGANVLNGRGGADRMTGGAGDDTYYIDNVGDRVVELAGGGVDLAISSVSVDFGTVQLDNLTLTGSAALYGYGNELTNILVGNAGANALEGRGGPDRLTGGAGADRFIFRNAAHSASASRDTITDLVSGVDKIDLTGIDARAGTAANDAFIFIGTGAFTGQAGQLRYVAGATSTEILGDLNGDRVADFAILLANKATPLASDFVL